MSAHEYITDRSFNDYNLYDKVYIKVPGFSQVITDIISYIVDDSQSKHLILPQWYC